MKTRHGFFISTWVCVAWLAAMLGPAWAATYYVAVDGSDENPGTESQPWRTIQHAFDQAEPGDTVKVGEGTYDEIVSSQRSGTPTARIVFDGQGVARMTRFRLFHAYITLRGFQISGEVRGGSDAIRLERGAHYTILENNHINTETNLAVWGITMVYDRFDMPDQTNAAMHCLIVSNRIQHILGAGALSIGGQFNIVRDNVVEDVYSADFLRLFGQSNLIQRNIFRNNLQHDATGFHPDFVQTFGENRHGSLGHVIDQNIIQNMEAQIVQLTMVNSYEDGQHGDWTFSNNIFMDITHGGSVGIPNTKWFNNLFYRVAYNSGHVLSFGNIEDRSNANGAIVFNNVFIDCGGIDRNNVGWYNRNITNLTADYNFVAKNNYGSVREANPPSNFRWYEENGINGGNPLFVNEEQRDFRPLPDSPLVGTGKNLSEYFQHDLPGNSRPQGTGWNIGPYQLTGGPPTETRPLPLQNLQALD
jgi:hypothetical protein